jgi:riboflavin kinase/FMN adenylyltransferase
VGFIDDLRAARPPGASVVTIGVFDGVHLGHRHLLARLNALAEEKARTSCVITFRNHPRTVLQPSYVHTYITPVRDRIAALEATGVGRVIPLTFTHELSQLSYGNFTQALMEQLNLRGLLIGPDFAMGRNRQGNRPALEGLGQEWGFDVAVAEPLTIDGEVVSSTGVRRRIEAGDMEGAERFLGRPFSMRGPVVHGEGRGRQIGFPTANLNVPEEVVRPADGIYATVARFGGADHLSVTSIGVRPTFGGGQRTIETYVLDFDGDLYGQTMEIQLMQRTREELRFPDVPSLVAQIQRDVADARSILASRRPDLSGAPARQTGG